MFVASSYCSYLDLNISILLEKHMCVKTYITIGGSVDVKNVVTN